MQSYKIKVLAQSFLLFLLIDTTFELLRMLISQLRIIDDIQIERMKGNTHIKQTILLNVSAKC